MYKSHNIYMMNVEENWEKLKRTIKMDLRYIYDVSKYKQNILSLNINNSVPLPIGYNLVIYKCNTDMTYSYSCK